MEDAYEKIGSIVEQWCEENMYTTMLVTISIGYEWETPHEETHLLEWDFESLSLIWDIDWWEGQQHVELVGFTPTHKIRLVGADAEVAPVRHGRWIDKQSKRGYGMSTYCSCCGQHSGIGGIESNRHRAYCPNCGAKMDGGNDG